MRALLSCSQARVRLLLVSLVFSTLTFAQSPVQPSFERPELSSGSPRPLITQAIDEAQLTVLKGNTHPLARAEFDLGTAPATLPMQRMLLVLKHSAEQEAAVRKLLDDQQDKSSPSYHKWLTPEEFGKQFGPTDADLQTITAWLQSHGFQVGSSKGRTLLEFSGSASQVQEAFHTTIHKYLVNGEQHWANASDPSIPTALTSAVAGLASLNNFPRHPMNVFAGKFSRDKATGKITPIDPQFTFPSSCVENNSSDSACFYGLSPYDFATIYDVLPLWNSGINGTGQTIAIVGESNINIQDVRDFRTLFALPANDPQVILNGPDPGIQGDESEADIDVQWSGAVAPNATIDFVVSQSTETTAGIDLSAVYIVENNLAPVMSESYGVCELGLGTTGNQFFNALWQQAAAQGITVMLASGDNGAAGCDDFTASSPAPAQFGLQVSGYASTPYNVAVGGTDFNDFSNPSTYWNLNNDPTTQASAKGYIPETTWNDSCTNAIFATVGFSSNAETNCNDSRFTPFFVVPKGGSGGTSHCTVSDGATAASCSGGYPKPSWQAGTGVPNDSKRDLPDVSLFASNGFLGNFYIVCQSDVTGSCALQPSYTFRAFGGTSVSSPAFAGIMALVNQQMATQGLSGRQGNANYVLYKLAAQHKTAFHDVTSGTIAMPCLSGSPNCTTTNTADLYGILTGYNSGVGYDLATGLGSVDANNLVTNWSSVVSLPSTTTLNSLTPTTITHGQTVNFSVTVTPKTGTGTPTGTVSLLGSPTNSTQGIAGFNLTSGTFSGSTDLLPGGTYSVTAHYPGDGTYEPSDSTPVTVTVSKENSQSQVFLVTTDSLGNIISGNTNTAVYGSPYLLRVNLENAAGNACNPVSSSGATACPSGNVTLTNNGAPLDAGTYPLNSYGYVDDFQVQLPGGTNSVKAAYTGDNSFNGNAATTALKIVPATTTIQYTNAGTVNVGQPANLSTLVQTESSGAAPTGTVTFSVNGSALAGTLSLSGFAGTPQVAALLYANLSNVVFNSVGSVTIVAAYSGDANYAPSSSSTIVAVQGFATNSLSVLPLNPQTGAPVSLTALIDTAEKGLAPSGIVVFNQSTITGGFTPIPGNITYTQLTDAAGNPELQATLSFVPSSFLTGVWAYYTEDPYYPQSSSNTVNIVVAGSDFTIYPSVPSATASGPGQAAFESMQIVGQASYSGIINFTASSCSGLPAASSCSFSPASVTGNGSTNLVIQTTAPSAHGARTFPPGTTIGRALVAALIFGGIFLLPTTPRRRSATIFSTIALVALLTMLPSCGGGSTAGNGGGGGNSGTPAGAYVVTVTATSGSGSTAITHTATFQLVVQ